MPEISEELEAWIETLPDFVQVVVREKPPITCYRSSVNKGHYWLERVAENEGNLTYTVLHGSDSFLPGFEVFGVDPKTLIPCGCNQWEFPTEEQVRSAAKVRDALLHSINPQSLDESSA